MNGQTATKRWQQEAQYVSVLSLKSMFFLYFFSFFYSTNYSLQINFGHPPPSVVWRHYDIQQQQRTTTSTHPNRHQKEGDKDSKEEADGDDEGDGLETLGMFFLSFFKKKSTDDYT